MMIVFFAAYILIGLAITTAIFYYDKHQDPGAILIVFSWPFLILVVPVLLADYLRKINGKEKNNG